MPGVTAGLPGMPGTPEIINGDLRIRDATSAGRRFITTFMQNGNSDKLPNRQILVTAALAPAKVSVFLNKYDFKKEVTVEKGQTVAVPIELNVEFRGTRKWTHPVRIEANVDVTVMSRNYKGNSGDMTLISPVEQLGLEYYIITPPNGPKDQYKEFLVLSDKAETTVDIYLKGSITVEGKNYSKGDKLSLTLTPYEAFQIQSKEDLSGTRVVANNKIAVMAGHTCAENNNGCSHVYEQLKPIGSWGTSFIVPGLSFQSKYDLVLIMVSQITTITYQSGTVKKTKEVAAGELTQIKLNGSSPLSIQSANGMQVLLHGLGGTYKGKQFGSFLSGIRDTNSFGLGYSLIGEKDFDTNLGIIIAKTLNAPEIKFDNKSSKDFVWKNFPGTNYSWVEYNYGSGFSTHTIQHPTIPFGLLSIGYGMNMAYGSSAPCFKGTIKQWRKGYWRIRYRTKPTQFQWNFTTGIQGGFPGFPGFPGTPGMNLEGMNVSPGISGGRWTITKEMHLVPGTPGAGGLIQNEQQTGISGATSAGRTFITAFLQNGNSDKIPDRQILVTAALAPAKVSVILNKSDFKKEVTVEKGQTVAIPIGVKNAEFRGTRNSPNSVRIEANADVTVMSRNYKGNSGDMTLISPVEQLGLEYYIITPPNGPKDQYKEFNVLSDKNETKVDIYLKGSVNVTGKNYSKGDKLSLTLMPYEAFQIQSKEDLSGTRVVANNRIAVMAGHTCAENNNGCSHVYEQLKPIESWGTSFLVPGLSFQTKYDQVLVMASKGSTITYQSGTVKETKEVAARDLTQIKLNGSSSFSIQSTNGMQVLLHGLGGTYKGKQFGSFLSGIRDTNSFGLGYSLIGEKDFDTNLGIIIAKTLNAPEIKFDNKSSKDFVWKNFPGSNYSWVEYNYGSGFSTHTIQHPTIPFGLLSIGYGMNTAYGSSAPCFRGITRNWLKGSWKYQYSTGPTQVNWSVLPSSTGEGLGLVPGVLNAGGNLLSTAGGILKGVGDTAGGLTGGLPSSTGEGQGLLSGVLNAGGNIISTAGDLLHGVGDTAAGLTGGLPSSTGQGQGLLPGVLNAGGNLLSTAGGILNGVGDMAGGLTDAGGNLLSTAGGILKGVGDTAGGLTGNILQGAGGTAGGATNGLNAGGGLSITGAGSPSSTGQGQGLLSGILNAGGNLISTAGGILKGVGDTAAGLAGGSPSSTGQGQGQGLISGVLNAGGNLLSDAGNILQGIGGTAGGATNGISGSPPTTGAGQGLVSGVLNAGGNLLQNAGGIVKGIGGTVEGLGQGLGGLIQKTGEAVGGLNLGLINGLPAGFPATSGQQQMSGMGGFPITGRWTFQYGGSQMSSGWRKTTAQGRFFVTMLLENTINVDSSWRFMITGTSSSTSVSIVINNSDFKKDIIVGKGETVTFEYPNPQLIKGSGISPRSMIIIANADITVMSNNYKGTSGDVALIDPVELWGTEYYIVTPTDGPSKHYAELGVLAHATLTTVTMVLSGAVQYKGKNYKKGDTMMVDLEPFEFLQLQSKDDLSGTRVTAQFPVAVLSGRSCLQNIKACNHVYEQLLPEENWGTSYFIPGFSFQSNNDLVYVMASKSTCIEHQLGGQKGKDKLEAGKMMRFKVSVLKPLAIHSTEKIQVMLYGTGGILKGKPFGSFLTSIPDIEFFNLNYNLIGQKEFDNNLAIIIAKTSSGPGFLFNGKVLQNTKWQQFPQSEYSWLEYNYGGGFSSNTVKHPTAPFGLLSIGYSKDMAYGTVAPGIQVSSGQLSEIQVPGPMIMPNISVSKVVIPEKPVPKVVTPEKPAIIPEVKSQIITKPKVETPKKPENVPAVKHQIIAKPKIVTPKKHGSSSSEEKHKKKNKNKGKKNKSSSSSSEEKKHKKKNRRYIEDY